MKVKFNSRCFKVGNVIGKYTDSDIKAEPMLYSASIDFAKEAGGKITNDILSRLEGPVDDLIADQAKRGYHPVIDTKKVLLMPGQYPCIPGWHCDGVIRRKYGGQPDISTIAEPIQHFICTITEKEDVCPTEFVLDNVEIDVDPDNVWKSVDSQLTFDIKPTTGASSSGVIYQFNRSCLHRGLSARARCWRFFFRLSFYHTPPLNEIREQVQIYCDINKGW